MTDRVVLLARRTFGSCLATFRALRYADGTVELQVELDDVIDSEFLSAARRARNALLARLRERHLRVTDATDLKDRP